MNVKKIKQNQSAHRRFQAVTEYNERFLKFCQNQTCSQYKWT